MLATLIISWTRMLTFPLQYLIHWPMASKYDGKQSLHASAFTIGADRRTENDPEPKDADGNHIVYDTPIFNETWARLEKLYESGKAKAIGVSNFSVKKSVFYPSISYRRID